MALFGGARQRREYAAQIAATTHWLAGAVLPPPGHRRVLVLGPKGGASKTTTIASLGLVLSQLRGEVVAVADMNPDDGTLRDRLVPAQYPPSTRQLVDLLADPGQLDTFADLSEFSELAGKLRVLTNVDADPAAAAAGDVEAHTAVLVRLARVVNLLLIDSGTSLVSPVVTANLNHADHLVVASSHDPVVVHKTFRGLEYLASHGREDMVRRATVVCSVSDAAADVETLRGELVKFAHPQSPARTSGQILVPYDPALSSRGGGLIRWDALAPATQLAYLQLAVQMMHSFLPPQPVAPEPSAPPLPPYPAGPVPAAPALPAAAPPVPVLVDASGPGWDDGWPV